MQQPDDKKQTLLEIFEKIVLPDILEEYWTRVWKTREEQNLWHERSIFSDLFKVWAVPDEGSKTHGRGGLICVVPAPREFWDTLIAVYALKVPGFLDEPALACRYLVKNIEIATDQPVIRTVEGDFFKNLQDFHWKYLTINAYQLGQDNFFMTNPFKTVCVMKMQQLLGSNPKPVVEGDLEKWKEWLPKWEEQILEETRKKFEALQNFETLGEECFITLEEFSKSIEFYTD